MRSRPLFAILPILVLSHSSPADSYTGWPVSVVSVDLKDHEGPLETWRQSLGLGGVSSQPVPDRVIEGVARLKPRLFRIFIQEFFFIYPEHDRFDWSRLDPYMDALSRTGAKVVAAITFKPKPLFPNIDPAVWKPNDIEEWQRVIAALVKRYSVDRPLVTHWEIGNETDIGESGGCPFLITDPDDYFAFYQMTIKPILETFPQAKVGGPAVANASGNLLPAFVERCAKNKTPLHFISWHRYSDDPEDHAGPVTKFRKLLASYPGERPQMFVTEWNKGFDRTSVEEMAFAPRRAAAAAAGIIAMTDAGVDMTFYYHFWDQTCDPGEFRPFFRDPRIMYHHWNEMPHRFGLFGVRQEVRPQYFVYWMLRRLGDRHLKVKCEEKDLYVLAAAGDEGTTVLLSNYGRPHSRDRVASMRLSHLPPGKKLIRVYRIDGFREKELELKPRESRPVAAEETFDFQVSSPADSVTLVVLSPAE